MEYESVNYKLSFSKLQFHFSANEGKFFSFNSLKLKKKTNKT